MILADLLQSGANVTVSVRIENLKEFAQILIEDTRKKLEQVIIDDKAECYIEPKEASQIFGVDISTLWRWAKRGYLVPLRLVEKEDTKCLKSNQYLMVVENSKQFESHNVPQSYFSRSIFAVSSIL